MIKSIKALKEYGFSGFKSVNELWSDNSVIPNQMGIYVIVNPSVGGQFLQNGVGGFFKGKNPNIGINELQQNWVNDAVIVYIGKAGGSTSSATLRKRINQYLAFGKGKAVGHYGGRLIWQLQNHSELLVAWKVLENEEPEQIERQLINHFSDHYGKIPFANLK